MKKRTTFITALTLTGLLLTGCTVASTQVARIDLEKAKASATEAAGFTSDEVSFHSVELDRRNGIEYYDVEFFADGKEYNYDIDALTGTVIGTEVQKEAETAETAKLVEPVKSAAANTSKELTEQEAKKIALAQVPGAKEADIREFEVDYDDGRLEYEGSIYFEEMEYEFEIDGYSGAIRSWEVESIYD